MTDNKKTLLELLRDGQLSSGQKLGLSPVPDSPQCYHVAGITPSIELVVKEDGLSLVASPEKGNFDFLWDCDIGIGHREGQGWYCEFCEDSPPVYYSTRRELLLNHTVIPFFPWVAEKLRFGNFLVFRRWGCGSFEAVILTEPAAEVARASEHFWKMEKIGTIVPE
ncbi:MAG: hypothetical protein HKM06_07505 [Spirochaetales bacterium]|nr:hypothetical protein [Spirochaetales bacterium]